MYEGLTWTCHICGERRLDADISVQTIPLIINGRELGDQNVRYCNDNPECVEKSKTFSLMKEEKE